MKRLNKFTLVEITMAIAIIGIGMAGVMALLPIGFNATRDAMADNYSSDMAEQFLNLIAMQCKNYSIDDGGTTVDGWGDWIMGDGPNTTTFQINTIKPDGLTKLDTAYVTKGNEVLPGSGIYYDGDATNTNGVFYIEAKSGDVVDFDGVMALWREDLKYDANNDGDTDDAGETIDSKYATRLCVEISWPYLKPYAQREKSYYVMEIFNPIAR